MTFDFYARGNDQKACEINNQMQIGNVLILKASGYHIHIKITDAISTKLLFVRNVMSGLRLCSCQTLRTN